MPLNKTIIATAVLIPGLIAAVFFANAASSISPANLPAIEYVPKCELAGAFVGLQRKDEQAGRDAALLCVKDEKQAQDWLISQWNGLETSLRRECLDHVQKTRKGLEYTWIMSCILNRLDP